MKNPARNPRPRCPLWMLIGAVCVFVAVLTLGLLGDSTGMGLS
jgi:hypothetical protein